MNFAFSEQDTEPWGLDFEETGGTRTLGGNA